MATVPEPPEDADNAQCYLKSAIPAPNLQPVGTAHQRIFSGVKGFTFF